jgi:membrane protease YdiL (CAAX protease family)
VSILRLAIVAWILVTLARVARVAWRQRPLAFAVWRAVRPRHVVGALGLLTVVAGLAGALIGLVPGMDLGLGRLVGLTSNAVFAPLEEGLARAEPPPETGPDWALILGASAFLLPLLLLLPWLAFVEEEVFRAGLEDAGAGRVALASLVFGLVHLVMLVPVAAALAIGVAGAFYARVYRRGHAQGPAAPPVARRCYRPTRRARRAAAASRAASPGVPGAVVLEGPDPAERQAAGVFAATIWHTTFNSLVVLLVWTSLVLAATLD